jgi:hypothetical protein
MTPSSNSKKTLPALLTSSANVVAATVGLSLMLLGWHMWDVLWWCFLLGVVILLGSLAGVVMIWLLAAGVNDRSSEKIRARNLEQLRKQFGESLATTSASQAKEVPRDGTPTQTAYYS